MSKITILSLNPTEGLRVQVADVVNWIISAFPGSRIIHENSFEAERKKYMSYSKKWAEEGSLEGALLLGIDLMIRSSVAKEHRNGPGKDILILTDGPETIQGRVWASSVLLFTDLPIEAEAVQRISNFLTSLRIGEPSVCSDDDLQ